MLVKDLIEQGTLHKTIDLLSGLIDATKPKKRKDDIMVRAYVVGSHYRKRPRKLKLVPPAEMERRRKLVVSANRLLKAN
jgi:hypothetical protein